MSKINKCLGTIFELMSTVIEIQKAIQQLSQAELTELARWLEEYRQKMFPRLTEPQSLGQGSGRKLDLD